MRVLLIVATMLMGLIAPVLAQDQPAAPWQATVTGQIEAFRAGDGAAALAFAGMGFRTQFEGQPEAFLAAIVLSGYRPIVESRSHSFGTFEKIADRMALQEVIFVGADRGLYEAVYRLVDEQGQGWRVDSVILRRAAGLAI